MNFIDAFYDVDPGTVINFERKNGCSLERTLKTSTNLNKKYSNVIQQRWSHYHRYRTHLYQQLRPDRNPNVSLDISQTCFRRGRVLGPQ